MFSSLFGTLGGFVGKFFGGGILSTTGRYIGKWLGDSFDDDDEEVIYHKMGRTIDEIFPISDAAGKAIPLVFGKVRVEGRLIWSNIIKEVPVESSVVKSFSSHSNIYNKTEFFYFCSFAIAICEGELNAIERIWVNDEILDLALHKYKIYLGSEEQLPDPLIKNSQKDGFCPAFKGLAYIVFEDFPLAEYGNKLPSFSFEVIRREKTSYKGLEEKIAGVNIIPGSGEYVYDTLIQSKKIMSGTTEIKISNINCNNREKNADAIYSLNYLKTICPKIKWAAPVVSWFAGSLDIGTCEIFPGIETKNENVKFSAEWQVAGRVRATAREISKNEIGSPNYGGTVNDASLIRYLQALKANGMKIMFYPMIFVDLPGKPWRGHMSGSPEHVNDFFNKPNGYNNFILHYANLVKGHVDAFIIGSELKSITSIRTGNNFPAVVELCNLAARVKAILGAEVKVSYAADWSEYHHCDGGWYHLDPLWASPNIDFVGIDNYMPLTDTKHGIILDADIKKGFASGEGYDYYLQGDEKHILAPQYAWKNIRWWWSNHHTNPDGSQTQWVPSFKKIWFTEYGFPSIDKACNQPNVFFDPYCTDGNIPKYSNSNTDFSIQRAAINHFIDYWETQEYIENMFLWCFDARPYPAWPHANIWRDSYLWEKGHWINGKIGNQYLADIISSISKRACIDRSQIDVSQLDQEVSGFCIANNITSHELINLLRSLYFFDIRDRNSQGLQFVKRQVLTEKEIDSRDIIASQNDDILKIADMSSAAAISNIIIKYNNIAADYKIFTEHVYDEKSNPSRVHFLNLPFSLDMQEARKIAEILITNALAKNSEIRFKLPINYMGIKPCDILKIQIDNNAYTLRVAAIEIIKWEITIIGLIEEIQDFSHHNQLQITDYHNDLNGSISQVILPENLRSEPDDKKYLYFINSFLGKKGLYISANLEGFTKIADIKGGTSICVVSYINLAHDFNFQIVDDVSYIDVMIEKNSPSIANRSLWKNSSMIFFNGKIFYASKVIKLSEDMYRLSHLIFIQDFAGSGSVCPNIGDKITFLDNMFALEYDDSAEESILFYQSYQGEKEIT